MISRWIEKRQLTHWKMISAILSSFVIQVTNSWSPWEILALLSSLLVTVRSAVVQHNNQIDIYYSSACCSRQREKQARVDGNINLDLPDIGRRPIKSLKEEFKYDSQTEKKTTPRDERSVCVLCSVSCIVDLGTTNKTNWPLFKPTTSSPTLSRNQAFHP